MPPTPPINPIVPDGASTFHLGDLLSLSTDRMVAPGGFSEVHRLIEHLAGGPVWTHQIPRMFEPCTIALRQQHPWLAEVAEPTDIESQEDAGAWLAPLIAKYGEWHEVAGASAGELRDPIAEAVDMVGAQRVIPVVVDGDQS